MLEVLLSSPEFWLFAAVGFFAQLIDGALGMAYGVVSIAALSTAGVAPAQASAVVHLVEVFTTGATGASHLAHRNIDWRLFARLAPSGIVGGLIGVAFLVAAPTSIVQPVVALYLAAMGLVLAYRAVRSRPTSRPLNLNWAMPIGGVGGLLDSWGGGWGPVVSSTLMGGGHRPRLVIGTVSLSEFFVTVAISASFVVAMVQGVFPIDFTIYAVEVAGLIVGGLLAAPLAGLVARIAPPRYLMTAVFLILVGLKSS